MQGLPGVSPQLRSRPLEGCGAASGTRGGTRLRGTTCERRLGSRRVGFLPSPREAQLCLPGAASKPAFGRMGGTFRPRLLLAGLQADTHSGRGPKLGGRRSCRHSEHASCPGRLRPGRAGRGRPGSCGGWRGWGLAAEPARRGVAGGAVGPRREHEGRGLGRRSGRGVVREGAAKIPEGCGIGRRDLGGAGLRRANSWRAWP